MKDALVTAVADVKINAGGVQLDGIWSTPRVLRGTVAFAHGSGSGRRSVRNQYVADVLGHAGLATLLLDLLTAEEEAIDDRTGQLRFDVDFLSYRLDVAVAWCRANVGYGALGLFGASTGAAAALISAARHPTSVDVVVSRGGRPDMAASALPNVKAPTLLIVGSEDRQVVQLNRTAAASLTCPHELAVVGGATHLFEEPGALEQVAQLARDWFLTYLTAAS
ncbi:MAG: dienelactone hydrolase family protein [Candidatus Eremiobacteraeota bacterium]|nr:dienelactone hydrolase family protein [Candidatus Eremiobacteraeota bacterium]